MDASASTRAPAPGLALGELTEGDWRRLARLEAPHGVISLVVDHALGGRRRGVERLRREADGARRLGPVGDQRPALWRTMVGDSQRAVAEAIGARIGSGERSRAFFCPVGATRVVPVASPLRLPESCTIGRHPRLTEVALASSLAAVRGVIGITRQGLAVTEYWGPHARARWEIPFGPERDGRRREGPARGGPRRAVLHGDLLERQRDQEVERAVAEAVGRLARRAVEREWTALVVGGDMREVPRVVKPLARAGVMAVPHSRHVASPQEQVAALAALDGEIARRTTERLAAAPRHQRLDGAEAIRPAIAGRAVGEVFVGVRKPAPGWGPALDDDGSRAGLDDVVRRALAEGLPVVPVVAGRGVGLELGSVAALRGAPAAVGSEEAAAPVRPGVETGTDG